LLTPENCIEGATPSFAVEKALPKPVSEEGEGKGSTIRRKGRLRGREVIPDPGAKEEFRLPTGTSASKLDRPYDLQGRGESTSPSRGGSLGHDRN